MAIKLTNITLKNFYSIGNATQAIKLDQHGLTLVLGSNTDANGGTTRNGAGKTTILQAICYGLYGKPLTKIKVGNLVNNINNKQMLVTVEFERDDKKYRIERGQKPAVLRWFVDDKEIKDTTEDQAQGENRHTQDEIERAIGMSYTLFKQTVALNTFTDPFLKMSAADQRNIIEELLGVTQISTRAETLKKLMNQTKEGIRDNEAIIKATSEANNRIETAIRQAEANAEAWERTHERTLSELQSEIETVENIDFDAEITVFDALDAYLDAERDLRVRYDSEQKEAAILQRDLKRYETEATSALNEAKKIDAAAQIKRLEGEIARKERDAERHMAQVAKFKAEIVAVDESIAGSDGQICVCCDQPLTGTEHLATVIANLEAQRAELQTKIEAEEKEAAERRAEVDPIRAEIAQVETNAAAKIAELEAKATERRTLADEVRARVEEHDKRMERIMEEIANLGERPDTLFKTRDEVYRAKQMYDTLVRDLDQEMQKQNPFTAQIAGLRTTIQPIDYEPLNDLQSLFKHQDFLFRLLTNKDSFIRKKIIDQNLAYLNTRLNGYLDKLGLPHEVRFMSDLSVEISLLGRDFDFEQLSRGEMNRVIMSTSWAFRDVWESLNDSLNLLWVDELIDSGMDDQGAEAALEILKKMARDRGKNVYLISHKDNLVSRVSRILLVHKENSFTRFEEDATV